MATTITSSGSQRFARVECREMVSQVPPVHGSQSRIHTQIVVVCTRALAFSAQHGPDSYPSSTGDYSTTSSMNLPRLYTMATQTRTLCANVYTPVYNGYNVYHGRRGWHHKHELCVQTSLCLSLSLSDPPSLWPSCLASIVTGSTSSCQVQ